MKKETKVLVATILVSTFLLLLGFITGDKGILGISLIFSTFLMIIPQLFLRYEKYRAFKEMEEKFPNFLRDLIESLRSGMPFHQAIVLNSRVDYGKLSPEVLKMANQISWGMPFDKVIDQFAERMKKSKRLNIAIKTIKESYSAGGDVVGTLDSVADSLIILDDAEKEKKSLLSQYVVLMYAISFIFVGIVVALNRFLIPVFRTANLPGSENIGLINPCNNAVGVSLTICDGFGFVASNFFGLDPSTISAYYTTLFFFMSLMVSIFSGLVAGQISDNSVVAGIRHSVIMTVVVVGAFLLMIQLKFIGV